VIAKVFRIAKTFRSYRANFLRHAKSLRDLWRCAGLPDVIRRHASAPVHHESHQLSDIDPSSGKILPDDGEIMALKLRPDRTRLSDITGARPYITSTPT
jgi:hypothetical protein